MENYKKSLTELREMKRQDEVIANLTEADVQMAGVLGEILEAETVYLEASEANDTLILSSSINSDIFEAVGIAAHGALTESDSRDEDEEEDGDDEGSAEGEDKVNQQDVKEAHEGDTEEPDSEDNGSADDEEDEDEEDKEKDESEEISAEDAEELKEALVGMIPKKSYVVRTESGLGWVVNEGSDAHTEIGLAMFNKLAGLCEATEDADLLNNFLAEQKYAEKKGMSIVSENKVTDFFKKGATKVSDTWKSGKLGKAKVIGAGALGAGAVAGGAYGVKKLMDKRKAKKAEAGK